MSLGVMNHPARRLLCQYQHWGYLLVLSVREWTEEERRRVLDRRPHQSTMAHVPFLTEEFF